MKRTDQLEVEVRAWTNNANYGSTYGVASERFTEALRDASLMLQGAILRSNPDCTWFDKQKEYSLVAGTREYQIPFDAYYVDDVRLVEISLDGASQNYFLIERIPYEYHSASSGWPPDAYDMRGGYICLTPAPAIGQGTLRATYIRRMPTLDRPRGTIASLVGSTLTLNNDSFLDSATLSVFVPGEISIMRRIDGAAISYSCTVTTYNPSTRVLTVSAGPEYESGFSSTDLAGAMICLGKYVTAATGVWPVSIQALVERYLVCYAKWAIFIRDSSQDAKPGGNQLTAIENDIINAAKSTWGQIPVVLMDNSL